jgi:thermitase
MLINVIQGFSMNLRLITSLAIMSLLILIAISCSSKSGIDPIRSQSSTGSSGETGQVVITLSKSGDADITTIENPYAITLTWKNGLIITNNGPTVYDFTLHRGDKTWSAGIIETGMTTSPLSIPLHEGANGFNVTFGEKGYIRINGQTIHFDAFDDASVIESSDGTEYIYNEVVFGFKDGTSDSERYRVIREHNLFLVGINTRLGMHTGRIDDGRDPFDVVTELEREPSVKWPGINGIMKAAWFPNDPAWNPNYPDTYRWNMERIEADRAWDVYKDGVENGVGDATVDKIVICIADTGVYPHEDFDLDPFDIQVSYTYSKCFVSPGCVAIDNMGHGTSCGGIAAAMGNNSWGIAGFVWDPYILSLKCMSDSAQGTWTTVTNSVTYIGELASQFSFLKFVANYSLGGYQADQFMQEAAIFTDSFPNTLLISAAGNNTTEADYYPACFDQFYSIGASTKAQFFNESKQRWEDQEVFNECPYGWSTNWNRKIWVCAPGTAYIPTLNFPWTTQYPFQDPDCPYDCRGWYCDHFAGTSAATPHVTGLAGLVWNKFPNWTKAQVMQRIADTADPMHVPSEKAGKLGTGRINAYRAITGN